MTTKMVTDRSAAVRRLRAAAAAFDADYATAVRLFGAVADLTADREDR